MEKFISKLISVEKINHSKRQFLKSIPLLATASAISPSVLQALEGYAKKRRDFLYPPCIAFWSFCRSGQGR